MADTITEFLASIGYSLDEQSSRDFEASLRKIEELAKRAAVALAASATALAALVARTTVTLDSLYFAASRSETSATELQAMAYAFQQSGQSAARAGDVVEGFASKLRTMPTNEGIIQMLGVKTREHGALRNNAELMMDVVEKLNGKDYVTAYTIAGELGIDESDYANLKQRWPIIQKYRAEQKERDRKFGVDRNSAAESSMLLMRVWRALQLQLETLVDLATMRLAPVLQPMIDDIDAWIKSHQTEIVEAAGAIVNILTGALVNFTGFVEALAPVAEWFAKTVDSITGHSGLVTAMEAFGAAFIASFALRMLKVGKGAQLAVLGLVVALAIQRHSDGTAFFGAPSSGTAPGSVGPEASRPSSPTREPSAPAAKQSFLGGLYQKMRRALGFKDAAPTSNAPDAGPALDRTSFDEELKNPQVRQRLFAMTEAEVGLQGPDAQKAFMETIFNRAKARNQTLWQTLHGSYFPGITHSRAAGLMGSPDLDRKYEGMFGEVHDGSNISNYATGNDSGNVHSDGAPITLDTHGERFVRELQDLPWVKRQLERAANPPAPAPPAPSNEADTPDSTGIDSHWDHSEDEPPKPRPGIPPAQTFQNKSTTGPGIDLTIESIKRAHEAAARLWKPADKDEWMRHDPFQSSGLKSSMYDEDSEFRAHRSTKIVLHGDTDSHKTADHVTRAQQRINTDLINSAQTAVA